MEKNWIKVFESDNHNLINLLISILRTENINAISFNKIDSSYPVHGDIEVYVKNIDVDISKQIIKKYNE